MNIDRDIAARALAKAGEEPISNEEWEEGTSNRVRIIKEFYLATLLEALSSYDWTSQKKRARLTALTENDSEETEENLTGFAFMYPLPADCAKVVSIDDGKPYIVEGAFLFSDEKNPVLLYIKNYFTTSSDYENDDYAFYEQPSLDPTLSAYFECKLAASIALKLTGGADKYQMLYNEATIIANKAMKKSAEQARNRSKGNKWWAEELGLAGGDV